MILLLGGTSDSNLLAGKLQEASIDLILSTATEYGELLAGHGFLGKIIHGGMDEAAMASFCQENRIESIVDASHPFAQIASRTAMSVAQDLGLEYIRYERPNSKVLDGKIRDGQHLFDDYPSACDWMNGIEGNILVTTGSKDAARIFHSIQDKERLFFRFLPLSDQVIKMERLGLKANQLIAMQGPFSLEMNVGMIRQLKARVILTKESGSYGFVDEKIAAAKECGIDIAVIRRPNLEYPVLFSDMNDLVQYMTHLCAKR